MYSHTIRKLGTGWYNRERIMVYYFLRFTKILFFGCLLFLGSCFFAFAQSDAGITVVPTTFEEIANPNDILVRSLKITNESLSEKEFFIYKRNIKGAEAGGVPIFAEETEVTGYELTEWIQVQAEPLKIPPQTTIEVPITIVVPEIATPGSHFGGIFVSAEPPRIRQMGAGVGYEVVSIVSIRIRGDVIDEARIRSFSTDKLFYGSKNVIFNAKIENQGNILINPRGPLTISNMFGGEPEALLVNGTLAGVFPGTTRDFEFEWNSEGLGFGRYEAILALSYDGEDGQKTIDASLFFWVFPMKLVVIITSVFLTILFGGYFLTKYYINQAIMRAAGGRRIAPQRYRRRVGISRFAFVFTAVMAVVVLFLLILLAFVA